MKEFFVLVGIVAVIGAVVLGGIVINDVGPSRIVRDLETAGAVVLAIVGAVSIILAAGWSAARVNETRHAHKVQPIERQLVRETRILDGRLPTPPQVLTIPGALDAYPPQFAQELSQQRAQLDAPQVLDVPASAWEIVDWADLPHQ